MISELMTFLNSTDINHDFISMFLFFDKVFLFFFEKKA